MSNRIGLAAVVCALIFAAPHVASAQPWTWWLNQRMYVETKWEQARARNPHLGPLAEGQATYLALAMGLQRAHTAARHGDVFERYVVDPYFLSAADLAYLGNSDGVLDNWIVTPIVFGGSLAIGGAAAGWAVPKMMASSVGRGGLYTFTLASGAYSAYGIQQQADAIALLDDPVEAQWRVSEVEAASAWVLLRTAAAGASINTGPRSPSTFWSRLRSRAGSAARRGRRTIPMGEGLENIELMSGPPIINPAMFYPAAAETAVLRSSEYLPRVLGRMGVAGQAKGVDVLDKAGIHTSSLGGYLLAKGITGIEASTPQADLVRHLFNLEPNRLTHTMYQSNEDALGQAKLVFKRIEENASSIGPNLQESFKARGGLVYFQSPLKLRIIPRFRVTLYYPSGNTADLMAHALETRLDFFLVRLPNGVQVLVPAIHHFQPLVP